MIEAARTGPIVTSQYTARVQMNNYGKSTQLCDKWAGVVRILQARQKGSVQVAVYPYGGMRHEQLKLDG